MSKTLRDCYVKSSSLGSVVSAQHRAARSSCKIIQRPKRHARANDRIHRNAAASVLHIVNLPPPSADGGAVHARSIKAMTATDSVPRPVFEVPADPSSRIAELEKAVSSLKGKLTAVAIIGLLLGGGGVFGLVKIATEANKTAAEAKATILDTTVRVPNEKIASLERSIDRLEKAGSAADNEQLKQLQQQIEETESQLRKALDQFNSTSKSLASISLKVDQNVRDVASVSENLGGLQEKTASLATAVTDTKKIKAELQTQIAAISKSVERQASDVSTIGRDISAVKKQHADFMKDVRKKIDF